MNGERLPAKSLIIATGARPSIPDEVAGLAEAGFLTNETAFQLNELPESLIVLGGRYIALECAQLFARLGSRMTVLQRSSRILPDQSPQLTEALTGYLRQEGIEVVTGASLRAPTASSPSPATRAGRLSSTGRTTCGELQPTTLEKTP